MAIDFAAEGLLDGLDDDGARADRVRLLSELADAGVSLAALRRAVQEDRLALLPLERVLSCQGPLHTLREAAERSGQELEFVMRMRRALGLSLPDPDVPSVADDELRAIEAPLVGPVLEGTLAGHLREQVSQDVLGRTGADGAPGTTRVAVAFADLVGFTRLGEERSVEELGAVARRLEELATDPVRLVKLIGDAAMLSSASADALLDACLSLIDACEAEGGDFPLVRLGGAIGEAVLHAGDVYGPQVNLASRLTAAARPGSMLVDGELRDAASAAFRFSYAGRRRLKHIRHEVPTHRVRRAERAM